MITGMRDISSRYIAESAMLFLSSSLPFPHPLHIFFLHFCQKKPDTEVPGFNLLIYKLLQ